MYTIGQVSEMFNVPVSTLRYYDKEGLFPNLQRSGNIRQFDEPEIEQLRVIECLKKSGMEIKDIRAFMGMVKEGPSTYGARKKLFEARRDQLEEEIAQLQHALAMAKFKCWYYETALADGSEDRLSRIIPNQLPPQVRALYDASH